jgi:hypothetical protein
MPQSESGLKARWIVATLASLCVPGPINVFSNADAWPEGRG